MERNCKFFRLAYHKSKLMQSDKKLHFLTHKINFQKMGKNFHLLLLFVEDASVSCSPDPTTSSKTKQKRIFTNVFDKLEQVLHVLIAYLLILCCLKNNLIGSKIKIHEEIRENLGIVISKLVVGSCERDIKFISTFDFDFPKNEIIRKSRSWRRMSLILSMVVRIRAYS
jgi:hypothetical protein